MAPPLEGLRVIDLTANLAGPYCGMVLADLGADVIKVERPGSGDNVRALGPPWVNGEGAAFLAVNRGKRSLSLDLKHPDGRNVLIRLAERSDFLVENMTPGTLDRLGLGYNDLRAVNPRLIYCSISGFGQTGPYRERGGYDTIAQGLSGIMSATGHPGQPPAKAGVPIADIGTGVFGVIGMLAAHAAREKSGRGQYIDTSLLDCALAWSVWEVATTLAGGPVPKPFGSVHRRNAPHQAFRTADGYITVAADRDHFWKDFTNLLGVPRLREDPRFKTNADRLAHQAELEREIEAVLTTQPAAYWIDRLVAAEIPCGHVYRYDQVFDDPHVKARGALAQVRHTTAGEVPAVNSPLRLSETPVRVERSAPLLGEHTEAVLTEIGYSAEEVRRLRDAQVVAAADLGTVTRST
ncbi:MAG TPA: CoA transferase [Dehalococcoidia bacterium]|nr:CoA transferase [Dehalococcoidia bacterium]